MTAEEWDELSFIGSWSFAWALAFYLWPIAYRCMLDPICSGGPWLI